MKKYFLTSLIAKQYSGSTLIGFIIDTFSYDNTKMECVLQRSQIGKRAFYEYIQNNCIVPINFTISSTRLTQTKFKDAKEMMESVVKTVRHYMEITYGTGTDLAGRCIEASEYIKKIFKYLGYIDVETVEGWCLFDSEDYGSDVPYDPHTWVEIDQGKIYIDVTADQFNPGMFIENYYKPIIVNRGLPHGMMHNEPEEGVDYWLDE